MRGARNLYGRIVAPIALLLALNVAIFAWIVWRQLSEDAAANMHSYAAGLDRVLVTTLRESMRRDDRDHLRSVIRDFGDLEWVLSARILDKEGVVHFDSDPDGEGSQISQASETCRTCHREARVPAARMTVRKGSDDRSVLQAAETIRAEDSCVECHEVPVGAALGVLVVELDMAPLSHDVRRRASRNLWLLVLGSVLLLAILIFVVRRVVVGRLVSLSDAVGALRAGRRIQAHGSPVDEIDDLKETLAALGADLEGRRFASLLLRRVERTLNQQGCAILLLDADGEILLANDDAQDELQASFAELAGRSYFELSDARRRLWERVQDAPLVLGPEAREERGPGGADHALAALFDDDDRIAGYIEVGRKRSPDDDGAAAADRAERGPVLPEAFLHTPYSDITPAADRLMRGILMLTQLTPESLRKDGVLELDPTLAHTLRTFKHLLQFRELIDEQVDRCDMEPIVRATANDFRRANPGAARWYILPAAPTHVVGHPVLMRQLATLLLQLAAETRAREVVVFLQRQRQQPKFFFGVWMSTVEDAPRDPVRWQACVDIARRFNGTLEMDPAYDSDELRRVHSSRLPALGKGALFVAQFPSTLG
jgi:hypothetical protein